MPDNPKFRDYIKYGNSWVGHGVRDVFPYWLTLNSNTRNQFELKIIEMFD